MISNEIIYGSVLIFSIVVGIPLRKLLSFPAKQIFTGGIGFVYVFGICHLDGLHSLITFIGNLLIIKLSKKHTSLLSFLWCFTYLLFFRCATFFSLPRPSPLANAIQLMLTLKLVSVAIEIHDFRTKKNTETSTRFQLELQYEPSAFDMFCYSYCYTGLFTGPFFKYRTYHDYLVMDQSTITKMPWREEVVARLRSVALFAVLYFVVAHYFNVDYPKSDLFYTEPLWYRVFYMVPIFFIGRMRFYTAWLLAECSFVTLTLGAYPKSTLPRPGHGPTIKPDRENDSEEYNFETIRNIDPYGCDFSPTVRLGMRNWNMGVQWWLANNVHKRWPNNLKQIRIAAVMGVSAYWHGIDPGYFGAFLTMPFIMLAEDLLGSLIKKRLPTSLHKSYDWMNWFAKMRSFEYMYMAFALLTWHDTYRYWKSTYFWLHIVAVCIIIICMIIKLLLKKPRVKETDSTEHKKDN